MSQLDLSTVSWWGMWFEGLAGSKRGIVGQVKRKFIENFFPPVFISVHPIYISSFPLPAFLFPPGETLVSPILPFPTSFLHVFSFLRFPSRLKSSVSVTPEPRPSATEYLQEMSCFRVQQATCETVTKFFLRAGIEEWARFWERGSGRDKGTDVGRGKKTWREREEREKETQMHEKISRHEYPLISTTTQEAYFALCAPGSKMNQLLHRRKHSFSNPWGSIPFEFSGMMSWNPCISTWFNNILTNNPRIHFSWYAFHHEECPQLPILIETATIATSAWFSGGANAIEQLNWARGNGKPVVTNHARHR